MKVNDSIKLRIRHNIRIIRQLWNWDIFHFYLFCEIILIREASMHSVMAEVDSIKHGLDFSWTPYIQKAIVSTLMGCILKKLIPFCPLCRHADHFKNLDYYLEILISCLLKFKDKSFIVLMYVAAQIFPCLMLMIHYIDVYVWNLSKSLLLCVKDYHADGFIITGSIAHLQFRSRWSELSVIFYTLQTSPLKS